MWRELRPHFLLTSWPRQPPATATPLNNDGGGEWTSDKDERLPHIVAHYVHNVHSRHSTSSPNSFDTTRGDKQAKSVCKSVLFNLNFSHFDTFLRCHYVITVDGVWGWLEERKTRLLRKCYTYHAICCYFRNPIMTCLKYLRALFLGLVRWNILLRRLQIIPLTTVLVSSCQLDFGVLCLPRTTSRHGHANIGNNMNTHTI